MKVLLFAPDSRCFQYLSPIASELSKRNHHFFLMGTAATVLQEPTLSLEHFKVFSNDDIDDCQITSGTLNTNLPFIPDYVILARENWPPETNIIREFKERFGSKVCLVEVNTHLINLIETKMEMLSRNTYPQNDIDVFFDQSKTAIEARQESGWECYSSSISVGNPLLDQIKLHPTENVYKKYKIDKNKKSILFYSLINISRSKSLEVLKNISEKAGDEYQIFYKPYPGEPWVKKYKDIFEPEFFLKNVTPIIDHIDILAMQKLCDIHIGAMSSVMSVPLYLNKFIVNINNVCDYLESGNDLNVYKEENTEGYSDGSANFWMGVHNLKTYQDFVDLVEEDLEKFKERNEKFRELIKETTHDYDEDLSFLKLDKKDSFKMLELFDEYHDGKASERIVNYLEANINA